ncbi:MAG: hypothetical protein HY695_13415 [Deltaproteobacteria bacterium]|nr:hypothetical protein [Deltaproteobacteria bacterium]
MSNIILPGGSGEDLAYYNKIRDTIHGLDGVIVKVINDSVTMTTGALGLSVLLYDKLDSPLAKLVIGLILVLIAFLSTVNARGRIKLYSGLLGGAVELAKTLELRLFAANERLTSTLENVPRSGLKGEKLYLRSTFVFYPIEIALAGFFVWRLVPFLIETFQ